MVTYSLPRSVRKGCLYPTNFKRQKHGCSPYRLITKGDHHFHRDAMINRWGRRCDLIKNTLNVLNCWIPKGEATKQQLRSTLHTLAVCMSWIRTVPFTFINWPQRTRDEVQHMTAWWWISVGTLYKDLCVEAVHMSVLHANLTMSPVNYCAYWGSAGTMCYCICPGTLSLMSNRII